MQIHEITHKQIRLREAPEYETPGGIVIPQGAKTAASAAPAAAAPAAPAAAPAAAAPRGIFQKARDAVSGAAAGFQQSQQQRQVQQNTAALAKAAMQQWNNKVIQLTQAAGGQPVDPDEYENQLSDFVERVMLKSYKIGDMESQSQTRIEQALGAVVQSRNDRRALAPAFEKLVQQAMVARLDPAKTSYQSPAAQKTVGPGAKQAPGAQTPAPQQQLNPTQAASAVNRVLRGAQVNAPAVAQALQKVTGGPLAVQPTNSTVVNALLKTMGIQVR